MQKLQQKAKGKDIPPKDTIAFIESLLDKAGIKTDYIPAESTITECWYARLNVSDVPGEFIGTNGKGIGKDFCKASAYGELMERLQNKAFFFMPLRTDPCLKEFHDICKKPLYHARDLEQPECMQNFKKKIAATVKSPVSFLSQEMITDSFLDSYGIKDLNNAFETDVFYHVEKDVFVNLPSGLISSFTGSNGMAAGNSLEEAIVQGMSEIMERFCARAYLNGEYIPPEIPRQTLKNYPQICNIISEIEESGKYHVIISDCSMGKNIPVVCGTIIDTENNSLGIKFASHPDMEIALERIFTEAMQGSNLDFFTKNNPLSFTINAKSRVNNFNFMKVGMGQTLPSVLFKHPSYKFVPWEDVSALGNKELAQKMVKLAETMGGDVYISNRSFLGFPTVFIYVTGISELQPLDIFRLKELVLHSRCSKYFRHLNDLNDDQVKELFDLAQIKCNALLENTISRMSGVLILSEGQIVPQDALFFEAICLYRLGMTADAANVLERCLTKYKNTEKEMYSYISCATTYVKAKEAGVDNKDIEDIIRQLYSEKIAQKVLYDFDDPMRVLSRVYPLCNGKTCEECDNSLCCYPQVCELFRKLVTLEAQNPPDSNALRAVFCRE